MPVAVRVKNIDNLRIEADARKHRLIVDEPGELGGADAGAAPYEYLLTALGACTAMTLRLYARRKEWPLGDIIVELRHRKADAAEIRGGDTKDKIDLIERDIALSGNLDAEQRQRLLEIAEKCPVHKTIESDHLAIRSRLV